MDAMERMGERETMRTSHPGNDRGFVLMDALVSLFVAGVAMLAICACVASTLRLAGACRERTKEIIEQRNTLAMQNVVREGN